MLYLLEKYFNNKNELIAPMPPPMGTSPLYNPSAVLGSIVMPNRYAIVYLKSNVPKYVMVYPK